VVYSFVLKFPVEFLFILQLESLHLVPSAVMVTINDFVPHALSVEDVLELLTVICCALFFGNAMQIYVVTMPALFKTLDAETAVKVWYQVYHKAFPVLLALVAGVSGFGLWFKTGRVAWLTAGLLQFSPLVWTAAVMIRQVNTPLIQLHEKTAKEADPKNSARIFELLRRWRALHGVRTFISLVAFIVALLQLV